MTTVAILVAASPTQAFLSQVAVLKRALEQLAWSRWRFSLHLYLGGPRDPAALDAWLPHLQGVDIHWASEVMFSRDGDWAQSDDIFRFAPTDADVLLALDADTLPVDVLEPVLDKALGTLVVCGVVAHYPTALPLTFDQQSGFAVQSASPNGPPPSVRNAWHQLARGLCDAPLDFSHSHTLMGVEVPIEHREAPFYLNFGVVFFPREAFDALAPTYLAIRPRLMNRLSSPDFSGQAALTLAIAATKVGTWALPMRYNFPNDPIAERMYPTELEHVVVLHYLRTNIFDRHHIFVSPERYERFLALPLEGVNRRFQEAVRGIVGERYPFA